MADSSSLKQQASVDQVLKDSQKIPERPLDPTRDAEDMLGDMTGRTGVTTGSAGQVSAEPDDMQGDESVFKGGEIDDPTHTNPTGFTREQLSEEAYNEQTLQGMSGARTRTNEDYASEDEIRDPTPLPKGEGPVGDPMGTNHMSEPDDIPVAESGEETVSGTAPDVESDDDVGEMMKAYTGVDPDPQMDNPQELGIGNRMDNDEADKDNS